MYCPMCGTEREGNNNCKTCNYDFPPSNNNSVDVNKNVAPQIYKTEDISEKSTEKTEMAKKPVKKKKTAIIVVAVVVAVLALVTLVGGGIGIGYLVYINSDGYKTEQATICISEGNYEEGLHIIGDVDTTEAETLRGYVDLIVARDTYLESVSRDNNFGEYYIGSYDDFKAALDEFEQYYDPAYLEENLLNEYKKISESIELVESMYTEELELALIDVQMVQLNKVDKNRSSNIGSKFTIRDFQNRIEISEDAITDVEENYNIGTEMLAMDWYVFFDESELPESSHRYYFDDDPEQCCVPVSSITYSICLDIMKGSEYEIENCNSEIDEWLEKFEIDDELYSTTPDYDYAADMGDFLMDITSYSDMEYNAQEMVECLKMDVLFYLISGETPYSYYYEYLN